MKKQELHWEQPKGGWKEKTWYLVEGATSTTNPVHKCILFTGILDRKGNPCGYSGITSVNYYSTYDTGVFNYPYIRPIKELYSVEELQK